MTGCIERYIFWSASADITNWKISLAKEDPNEHWPHISQVQPGLQHVAAHPPEYAPTAQICLSNEWVASSDRSTNCSNLYATFSWLSMFEQVYIFQVKSAVKISPNARVQENTSLNSKPTPFFNTVYVQIYALRLPPDAFESSGKVNVFRTLQDLFLFPTIIDIYRLIGFNDP